MQTLWGFEPSDSAIGYVPEKITMFANKLFYFGAVHANQIYSNIRNIEELQLDLHGMK